MDESALANQYQLLEELGSGSFGVVYKAIEVATGEVVAVKHIDLESSEDDIQEIQGEISCLSSCASPHVTQYKASFLRGSKLWIIMEYLGGGSCQDLLKPGPFLESHVAIVCRELLLGLDYLHREGKIHRDIKAANILLTQAGKVKLADFGVAAQLNNIKSIRNTLVGTPFWMAPEVIQEEGYDFKADIWSLGITAIELINGAPPHSDMHPMKVLFHIPRNEAPRLEGKQYSRELKDFVAACLVKDPDRRPTAKQLLHHKFIRQAGKVEGLQEIILRRQMWDSKQERASEPRYYQESMNMMSSVDEQDEWVFDTVKASTVGTFNTNPFESVRISTVRKASGAVQSIKSSSKPESMISRLTLEEPPIETPQTTPPSTIRRTPAKRRASPSQQTSSVKRKSSVRSTSISTSSQRKPLAPDMSFGNGASTTRQFSRVSNNTPEMTPEGTLAETDENRPPFMESTTKESLVGRRACSKVIDGAFQEVLAQTGNYEQREAIKGALKAWRSFDLKDPEGEFMVLKLMIERIASDPRLSSLLPENPLQPGLQRQNSQQQPKLMLAQNNPHLKSHKRRQSSVMTSAGMDVLMGEDALRLPGIMTPGMEHTFHIANGLYSKWAENLSEKWPNIE